MHLLEWCKIKKGSKNYSTSLKKIKTYCILFVCKKLINRDDIMEKRFVYADNAATTKISKSVLEKMLPYLDKYYGNPSSLYSIGMEAAKALAISRSTVAACIGAEPEEIFFTSGGTESDNWAIKGVTKKLKSSGKNHIITSKIEHHAVLHTVQSLEKEGFEVTYLDVDSNAIVNPNTVSSAIKPNTALVSIMYANNEVGTIQPIEEISSLCKDKGVLFHTDAVQALGKLKINLKHLPVDMMSISAHKINGPKGCGALYVKKGVPLLKFMDGGAQESNRRAGTENIASIVGFAQAIKEATSDIEKKSKYVQNLRDKLIEGLCKIDKIKINGDLNNRLAGNVNVCFEGIEGESLVLSLSAEGICASTGSACASGSLDPSHVLLAMGIPYETAHGSLRLTLDENNDLQDVEYILHILPRVVQRLRDMSPLWEKLNNK